MLSAAFHFPILVILGWKISLIGETLLQEYDASLLKLKDIGHQNSGLYSKYAPKPKTPTNGAFVFGPLCMA